MIDILFYFVVIIVLSIHTWIIYRIGKSAGYSEMFKELGNSLNEWLKEGGK